MGTGGKIFAAGDPHTQVINPETKDHFLYQPPSDQDIINAKNRAERGASTDYSIVIGTAKKTVFLYDGNGVLATFPIEEWKNAGK